MLGLSAKRKEFCPTLSEAAAGAAESCRKADVLANIILNEAYASVTSVPRLSPVESWAQDL